MIRPCLALWAGALLCVVGPGCTDKRREAELLAREAELNEKAEAIAEKARFVEERGETLSGWADELDGQQTRLEIKERELFEREKKIREEEQEIRTQLALLDQRKKAFEDKRKELLRGTVPEIAAKHAIVVDADTGMALYEKDADSKTAVASTQKLLTALLVVEAGNLDAMVTVEKSDTEVEPTKLYVNPDESYRRGDLLKALLVRSCNDLAKVLGRDNAGTLDAFIVKMNDKAEILGMTSSHFKNPHGLTEEGQYSTARDMSKLAIAAYRRPEIREIIGTEMMSFEMADGTVKKLLNTNRVLRGYEFCTGMKTGYTRASGFCLITSGSNGGISRIVVVLGSGGSTVWTDSQKLLEWALRA